MIFLFPPLRNHERISHLLSAESPKTVIQEVHDDLFSRSHFDSIIYPSALNNKWSWPRWRSGLMNNEEGPDGEDPWHVRRGALIDCLHHGRFRFKFLDFGTY